MSFWALESSDLWWVALYVGSGKDGYKEATGLLIDIVEKSGEKEHSSIIFI